ncbi:Pole4 [Columba guinea]|nr:Pole4 [Columba guinea]
MAAAVPVPVPVAEAAGPGEEAAGAGPQCPGPARLARLPLARVKALVKADPDVSLASQEAVFVLARATELFVETIAKDAYVYAQQGKRKTLQRKDLDNAIEAIDEFAFLEALRIVYVVLCTPRPVEKKIRQREVLFSRSGRISIYFQTCDRQVLDEFVPRVVNGPGLIQ